MQTSTRLLWVSAILAIAGLGLIDFGYGRYATHHFVPNMTLQKAEAAGTRCLVTLGDSRMAAGIDAPILTTALRAGAIETCVAPLAIGALPISGQAMALRRLMHDLGVPRWVVLGASAGTLLEENSPDPSAFFGNRAAELAWSDSSDIYRYYPRFPFADLDRGVRFWFARSNALTTYASATWIKTQALQDRLVGNRPETQRNRFGSLKDMQALLGSFRDQATQALAAPNGGYRLNPWFELVRSLVHHSGARLIVLEVPMPASYRREVLDSSAGRRYRGWLESQLARSGDAFLDMSAPRSIHDRDFADGIHLDKDGAKAFSSDLGEKLAPLLASAAAAQQQSPVNTESVNAR